MSQLNNKTGAVIVSWNFAHGDAGLVLVGHQNNGNMNVINTFSGNDAKELFEKLTGLKVEEK